MNSLGSWYFALRTKPIIFGIMADYDAGMLHENNHKKQDYLEESFFKL
jgi:hypothetical protein